MNLPIRRLALVTATICSIALTGCTLGTNSAPSTPINTNIGTIHGKAFGGNQPIVGASIYVYAAATSGYSAASTLLSTTVPTTLSDGSFTITGDYVCTAGQQVYLYASGGNPGLSGTNAGIGLLAILGTCPASGTMASQSPYVVINEASTVAAAYAFAGFAVDATHVADDEGVTGNTTATVAQTGMANAFANAGNLVNLATGTAYTTTGSITIGSTATPNQIPQAQIYTIADILAACVNTTGTSGTPSSNCSTLFSNATSDGTALGVQPTDTSTAAINIAHHPAANVAALYALVAASGAPFTPDDGAQPSDFTLSILYPQGGTGTVGLAVDGLGNAYGVYGGGATVYKFTPATATTFTTETALTTGSGPRRLAIDASNNVWIPLNSSSNVIDEFGPSATSATTPTLYSSVDTNGIAVTNLISLAFDPSGYLWAATGSPKKATLLNVSASPATAVTTVNLPATGTGLAVSPNGSVGIASGSGANSALTVTNSSVATGTTLTATATNVGGLSSPTQMIGDASGNFWIANVPAKATTNTVVSEISSAGAAVSTTGYAITPPTGDNSYSLTSQEIDGVGNYFTGGNTIVTSTESNSSPTVAGAIYELNSSGTQIAVFVPPTADNEFFAVDPSGNLWFGGNDTIGEMIGVAAPKVTPQVVANFPGLLAGVKGVSASYPNKVATRP